MNSRFERIDFMRGVSIIAMILIHTNAYFLNSKIAYSLWDISQFAVPVFIFCSAYLFFKKEYHRTINHSFDYYKKRVLRLILPYWTFLLFYFPLTYVTQPRTLTTQYVLATISATGGLDLSWMVLLFFELSLLMPPLLWLFSTRGREYYMYVTLALISAVVFLAVGTPHYRLIMWLPWSVLVLYTWYTALAERRPRTLIIMLALSIAYYLGSRYILIGLKHPLDHYHNKYPPNLFHLSYGTASITILFALYTIFERLPRFVKTFVYYFSAKSYSIYFIHFLTIFYLTTYLKIKTHQLGAVGFFTVVFVITYGVQRGIDRLTSSLR